MLKLPPGKGVKSSDPAIAPTWGLTRMAQTRNRTILKTGLRLDGVFGTYCETGSLSETMTISMSLASPRILWAASRENTGDLCGSFPLSKNHLRHAYAQTAMMINFRESNVFEGKMAQALHRIIGREFSRADLLEQFSYGSFVQGGGPSGHLNQE